MVFNRPQTLYPQSATLRGAVANRFRRFGEKSQSEICHTALHEASHVVIGYHLEAAIIDVTILPSMKNRKRLGGARVYGVGEHESMIFFAGVLAELALNYEVPHEKIDFGSDGVAFKEFCDYYLEVYDRVALDAWLYRTLATFTWNWRAIEAVAILLVEHADRAGYINEAKTQQICAYIPGKHWEDRTVEFPLPRRYSLLSDGWKILGRKYRYDFSLLTSNRESNDVDFPDELGFPDD